MWWLFEKVSEAASNVVYRYARGSDECTGKIVFDKLKNTLIDFQHCSNDHSDFDKKVAVSKFACFVVEEGFPDRRKVVCG